MQQHASASADELVEPMATAEPRQRLRQVTPPTTRGGDEDSPESRSIATNTSALLRRAEVLRTILSRWSEFGDPMRSGDGWGDGGVLVMPHERGCRLLVSGGRGCSCVRRDVGEVKRLLDVMRDDRHRSLIRLGSGEKVSVRSLGWHLRERFVACSSRVGLIEESVVMRGVVRVVRVRGVVEVWDSGVRLDLVEVGLLWLAGEWGLGREPMLPGWLRELGG